jgi:uncharacterized membrane protein (UPF0127 family)
MVMLGETLWVVCVANTPAKQVAVNTTSYDLRGMGAIGMLFIFGGNLTWCFWMRDTPLRLVWISGYRAAQEVLAQPLSDAPYVATALRSSSWSRRCSRPPWLTGAA